jgi:hypothetical protein
MWSPDAQRDGLDAFEGIEDDRANTDPGHKHIYVSHSAANYYYQFDMPAWNQEHDTSPDRQRNEVKGMHTGGKDLDLVPGQTWRLDWSLYLPSSVHGTDHFTHIMQLKIPGNGSAPLFTVDLTQPSAGAAKIQLKVFAEGKVVGSHDLAPLQNAWITSSVTIHVGAGPAGSVGWLLRDQHGVTLVDNTVSNVGTYLANPDGRVRPKWGIYRSLDSDHSLLVPCSMYVDNLRGYLKS